MAYLRFVDMPLLFQLQFTFSTVFWLLGCIALGIGYAILLYRSSDHLQKPVRNTLFALRALAVTVLAFLLFAPLLKTSDRVLEKPLIILAQDNSASIGISKPKDFNPETYQAAIKDLEKKLSVDYEVRSFQFSSDVKKDLAFNYAGKLTDMTSLFRNIDDQFANRNIGAVILATDGIYNHGGNPQYEAANVKAPIYTVALGDTIPKRDLLIANINYNNIVYLDNQFQIEVELESYQCLGTTTRLTVSDKSGQIFSQPITINSDEYRATIPVTLLANKKGIQRYTINLSPVPNELSSNNNSQTIFVEVLDGKQKILIVANAPHPDIRVLKQAIENNKNYEVKTVFIGDIKPADIEQAGLIIMHQLPSVSNSAQNVWRAAASKPILFILGAQTNATVFSQMQNVLTIPSTGYPQETLAKVKTDFYDFTLSENTRNQIQNFAPLVSPFGTYALKSPATVLLSQQIGRIATNNPMLLFSSADPLRKIGILTGEGLWRWHLEDYQENNNHDAVNEIVSKVVQYLSSKDDKRKFRVYPAKNTFDENENIVLNGELYNDSYELVNTPDVNITLKNTGGNSYTFLFSRNTNAYILDAGILPSGEYTFSSTTQLGKNKYTSGGQFVITQQQAEFQQTTANHQLLYDMARQSGGKLIYPSQLSSLPGLIKANEQIKTISYEDRQYEDLINLKLLFFVIFGLLTIEWLGRKRNGEL